MKNCGPKVYEVLDGQLNAIDEALDAIMVAIHILQKPEADDTCLVFPEAVASVLSLAHATIAGRLDEIRSVQT